MSSGGGSSQIKTSSGQYKINRSTPSSNITTFEDLNSKSEADPLPLPPPPPVVRKKLVVPISEEERKQRELEFKQHQERLKVQTIAATAVELSNQFNELDEDGPRNNKRHKKNKDDAEADYDAGGGVSRVSLRDLNSAEAEFNTWIRAVEGGCSTITDPGFSTRRVDPENRLEEDWSNFDAVYSSYISSMVNTSISAVLLQFNANPRMKAPLADLINGKSQSAGAFQLVVQQEVSLVATSGSHRRSPAQAKIQALVMAALFKNIRGSCGDHYGAFSTGSAASPS